MTTLRTSLVILGILTLAACGGGRRPVGDDVPGDDEPDPPDANTSCAPTSVIEMPGTCNDGFDNDCDLFVDCDELECSGVDGCPVLGSSCEVTTPPVSLSLPDGDCTGTPPPPGSPDAQMEAFLATCNAYEATMNLSGFPVDSRLTDPTQLLGICVKMEHSWLRDLQMEAYCPDGNRVLLSKFAGQTGGQWFLGEPYEADETGDPVPGVGYDYCWAHTAQYPPMIDSANAGAPSPLPPGDYQASEPLTGFQDCALNGPWKIRVVDGWGIDNGFIFEAKFVFHKSLSDQCPVIE